MAAPRGAPTRKGEAMNANPTSAVVHFKALAEHQRQACQAIESGKRHLSRAETSFLHRIREQVVITSKQRKYLTDLDARIRWELSLENL